MADGCRWAETVQAETECPECVSLNLRIDEALVDLELSAEKMNAIVVWALDNELLVLCKREVEKRREQAMSAYTAYIVHLKECHFPRQI